MRDKHMTARHGNADQGFSMGDHLEWFETMYAQAEGDPTVITWADLTPNPNLIRWLDRNKLTQPLGRAVAVGCGLGDDAEELARRGFKTVAFDVSATAIEWCHRRFPDSGVKYVVSDLLQIPGSWRESFDFVFESYTLQVLPIELRRRAIEAVADLVASGGTLLVIARGRNVEEPPGNMPWPLTRVELEFFKSCGMVERSFEDYMDDETPPVRRFVATYHRG